MIIVQTYLNPTDVPGAREATVARIINNTAADLRIKDVFPSDINARGCAEYILIMADVKHARIAMLANALKTNLQHFGIAVFFQQTSEF